MGLRAVGVGSEDLALEMADTVDQEVEIEDDSLFLGGRKEASTCQEVSCFLETGYAWLHDKGVEP